MGIVGALGLVERMRTPRAGSPAPARSPASLRLETMFVAHNAMVWRTLRRRGLSPDAAADVTQQAFLVAAERLGDINPDSERAFLIGTALRLVKALGRRT